MRESDIGSSLPDVSSIRNSSRQEQSNNSGSVDSQESPRLVNISRDEDHLGAMGGQSDDKSSHNDGTNSEDKSFEQIIEIEAVQNHGIVEEER